MDGPVVMRICQKTSICGLFFLTAFAVSAKDSEYRLLPADDAVIGVGAVGTVVTSELLTGNIGSQMPEENINGLDRSLILNYSHRIDTVSTISAYVALITPVLSVVQHLESAETLITYGIMYAEAFFLTMGTKNLLKIAVSRHRPYTYRGQVPPGDEDDYYNSFPSGHTSFAFLGATFLSQTFLMDFPDSSLGLPIVIGSYTLASGIGVLRILSGSHFVTDVFVGGLIGTLYGWLIPRLHVAQNEKQIVSLAPSPNGMKLSVKLR
jgi:membrane-associated phospholipid phosphatase